jgi:hypothetical protein
VAERLAEPANALATVVFHSVFWVYVPDPVRAGIERALTAAAETATAEDPLAWLRYEENPETPLEVELRLTLWPDGGERLLGVGRHHEHPVRWLA